MKTVRYMAKMKDNKTMIKVVYFYEGSRMDLHKICVRSDFTE